MFGVSIERWNFSMALLVRMHGKAVPGVIFMRGVTPAVLVVLKVQPENKKFLLKALQVVQNLDSRKRSLRGLFGHVLFFQFARYSCTLYLGVSENKPFALVFNNSSRTFADWGCW